MESPWITAIVTGALIAAHGARRAYEVQQAASGRLPTDDPGNLFADMFKQAGIGAVTGAATGGLGSVLAPATGGATSAIGSVAANEGASVGGGIIPGAVMRAGEQAVKHGLSGAASGAIRAGVRDQDPLAGALAGGAGGFASGAVGGAIPPPQPMPELARTDAGLFAQSAPSPEISTPDVSASMARPLYDRAQSALVSGVRSTAPKIAGTASSGLVANALAQRPEEPFGSPYKSGYAGGQYGGPPNPQPPMPSMMPPMPGPPQPRMFRPMPFGGGI